MENDDKEIFIPGACGRIQARYFKNTKQGAPVALVLQPHPQYGGTMNNRLFMKFIIVFIKMDFQ